MWDSSLPRWTRKPETGRLSGMDDGACSGAGRFFLREGMAVEMQEECRARRGEAH